MLSHGNYRVLLLIIVKYSPLSPSPGLWGFFFPFERIVFSPPHPQVELNFMVFFRFLLGNLFGDAIGWMSSTMEISLRISWNIRHSYRVISRNPLREILFEEEARKLSKAMIFPEKSISSFFMLWLTGKWIHIAEVSGNSRSFQDFRRRTYLNNLYRPCHNEWQQKERLFFIFCLFLK